MNDVTLVVNYHQEGHLANVSAASARLAAEVAGLRGVKVQLLAVLDRPDKLTRQVVEASVGVWDSVLECGYGDLGLARNYAVDHVTTRWMAFMDGDDLCGDQWLAAAHAEALRTDSSRVFFHPEWIFYFDESDLLHQSSSHAPLPNVKSFFMKQVDCGSELFDPNLLRFNNLFTSNQFGETAVYSEFPFIGVDRASGFGIEDWTWNAQGIARGLKHQIVADTVHLVRVRSTDSLGKTNARENLLPDLREWVLP